LEVHTDTEIESRFGVDRNTDFRFRESRIAERALESPRKQNSELQISDSQLGGSTSKVEYRFTDFRFRCARSARPRGQGVYISFSDFGVFTLIKNTSQGLNSALLVVSGTGGGV